MREKLLRYAEETYGTLPDYPWEKMPDFAVLRHRDGKWYGIIMHLAPSVLGLTGNQPLDVMNLKCDPAILGSLLLEPGFLPAYHMNKEHWISVILDGTVPMEQLTMFLDLSYDLNNRKIKRGGKT